MELVLNGGAMKRRISSFVIAFALLASQSLFTAPSARADVSLPKGSWAPCSQTSVNFCIESVQLSTAFGKKVSLAWGSSGGADITAKQGVVAGKTLPGRWSVSDWTAQGFGAFGYDGLYVDVKAANDFVPWVYVDAQPTLTSSGTVKLAAQSGNTNAAADLDSSVIISIQLRLENFQSGVSFGVGTDVSIDTKVVGGNTIITIEGNPVLVPQAKSTKDCTGNAGVASALIRQFQTVLVPQNDPMGFSVEGASGKIYVGSNGLCKLSTPMWDPDLKKFRYTATAPRLAPDGSTVNKGFYRAIIPVADAKVLWGLTNPNDAAKALVVSIMTAEGGSKVALSSISVRNANIIIDVSNFDFPDPALDIALNPTYNMNSAAASANQNSSGPASTGSSQATAANQKATAPAATGSTKKATTITCVKGKLVKKVTAVKPVCPKGYTKKK
jgi:hypothetical protein